MGEKVVPKNIDLSNGLYRVRMNIRGRSYSKCFDNIQDAETYLEQLKTERRRKKLGLTKEFQEKRFKEWCAHYFLINKDTWSKNTRELYSRIINDLTPIFGDRPLQDIYADEISLRLHELKSQKNWIETTFNRYHSLLKQIFKAAIEHRPFYHLEDNPMNQVKQLQEIKKQREIFQSVDQMQLFLSKAWDGVCPGYWIAVHLILNTGLRLGEVLALRRLDVHFSPGGQRSGYVLVNKQKDTKTGEERDLKDKDHRIVHFGEDLYEALKTWYSFDFTAEPEDFVVRYISNNKTQKNNGDPFSASNFDRMHRTYCKTMGLPPVTLHGLRHTYASHTLAQTGNLKALQDLLGHSSYETTLEYVQTLKRLIGQNRGLSVGGFKTSRDDAA